MKLFKCQSCGQVLYFENQLCQRCGHRLGYAPEREALIALIPDGEDWLDALGSPWRYRFCDNARWDACNWLVTADSGETLCRACRHNRTIPDLANQTNLDRWRRFETAKRRLFYSLMRLGLPLATRAEEPVTGLAFDFLADPPESSGASILTGHDNGLITINLREADDSVREAVRATMGEPYRTLLGHFRHESGHYFWDRLVRDGGGIEGFRLLFGDERQDYEAALKRHYAQGPPQGWAERFISGYAAAHPWEDFAECWAHYLHIMDTLEVAAAFGLRIRPMAADDATLSTDLDFDPYRIINLGVIVEAWLPLVFAMNSINRAMGEDDLYPFVLAPPVIEKLDFIHRLIRR